METLQILLFTFEPENDKKLEDFIPIRMGRSFRV